MLNPRRDANRDYFLGKDAAALVSPAILQFVRERAGVRVLDLGCGPGGCAVRLKDLGFQVTGVDTNPQYVEIARTSGIDARLASGDTLPFPDGSFDTVILIEVIEHLPADVPDLVLREAKRVARRNVLVTTPDCAMTPDLGVHGFTHEHYLSADHVQFYELSSLEALLSRHFSSVRVERGDPLYPHRLLPPLARRPLSALYRLGLLKTKLYSRLYAEAAA